MATYIIAEAGVNHNGDFGLATQLVDAAAEAGADAVKFQTFCASDLVTLEAPKVTYQKNFDAHSTQYEMLKRLELNANQFAELAKYCQLKDIAFLSTAFGSQELDLLINLGVTAIKVPSGEITNLLLLEQMATKAVEYDLPVFLSTGMCTLGEVEQGLAIFLEEGVPRDSITILHCTSAYPAPEDELNLMSIKTIKTALGCSVGYSDHSFGITAPIAAVALGAVLIEKHLTINRSLEGPDHAASLEPEDFKKMVAAIRSCESMLGNGIKYPQKSEMEARLISRRSIRAKKEIQKGDTLDLENISAQRPGDGLSPMLYKRLIGKKSNSHYKIGDALSE